MAAAPQQLSQLAWLASLNTSFNDFKPEQKFLRKVRLGRSIQLLRRKKTSGIENSQQTSIIGTIGPKTNSVDMLKKLYDAGLNIGTSRIPLACPIPHSPQSA